MLVFAIALGRSIMDWLAVAVAVVEVGLPAWVARMVFASVRVIVPLVARRNGFVIVLASCLPRAHLLVARKGQTAVLVC